MSLATARAELGKGHIIAATSAAMRAVRFDLFGPAWAKVTGLSRRRS